MKLSLLYPGGGMGGCKGMKISISCDPGQNQILD